MGRTTAGRRSDGGARRDEFFEGIAEYNTQLRDSPREAPQRCDARDRMLHSGVGLQETGLAVRTDLPPWAASSAGRALRSQCRGRGFDPPAVHHLNHTYTKSYGLTAPRARAPARGRRALVVRRRKMQ